MPNPYNHAFTITLKYIFIHSFDCINLADADSLLDVCMTIYVSTYIANAFARHRTHTHEHMQHMKGMRYERIHVSRLAHRNAGKNCTVLQCQVFLVFSIKYRYTVHLYSRTHSMICVQFPCIHIGWPCVCAAQFNVRIIREWVLECMSSWKIVNDARLPHLHTYVNHVQAGFDEHTMECINVLLKWNKYGLHWEECKL